VGDGRDEFLGLRRGRLPARDRQRRMPPLARRHQDIPGAAVQRQRQLQRPRVLVEDERRQRGEPVRHQRAPEIDRLAARAPQRKLGDDGHRPETGDTV
jgi:hypothetical protein